MLRKNQNNFIIVKEKKNHHIKIKSNKIKSNLVKRKGRVLA